MIFAHLLGLAGLAVSLDDTTMSLLARVDPIPSGNPKPSKSVSSLLESAGVGSSSVIDDSRIPFSGIQLEHPTEKRRPTPALPGRILNRARIHVSTIHLHDAPAVNVSATPEVLICSVPADHNGLSDRACDLVASSPAVLSQVLRCSDRVHPRTVADLLMGSQTVPIDFTQGLSGVVMDLAAMDTPLSVEVSVGACSDPRASLPDTDLKIDHIVFVLLNPDVEAAAENLALRTGVAAEHGGAFTAGLVNVGVPQLMQQAAFRRQLATNFIENVATCNNDQVCSAQELVGWTPIGNAKLDWFVGVSDATVRVIGGAHSRGYASFLQTGTTN